MTPVNERAVDVILPQLRRAGVIDAEYGELRFASLSSELTGWPHISVSRQRIAVD